MQFDKLFYPKSIAIVGASRREKTVGNDVVKNLVQQGYKGKIYPVNPKAKELYGKKVYADVASVPGDIDLVIVAIPAKFVTGAIDEAHKKGAGAAIVISAGCKEIGEFALENELAKYCRDKDIALVGPNCLGVINAEHSMNASFGHILPLPGNIAFVSQSGALCTAVLDYAQKLELGFSKFLSIGNKAVIDELTLLNYFADDDKTQVVAMYAEQLENAPEFIEAVKNLKAKGKPVIILKSGKTEEGASAVASHTGSLSGGDAAYEALFEQAGVIRANSISELFDLATVFSQNQISKEVRNAAILTNAGGPGVLTTDEVISSGLELAKLSDSTQKKLEEFLPPAASVKNPVDILGDAVAERYEKALSIVEADENVDSIIVILTPQSMTESAATARAVVQLKKKSVKPIVVSFLGQEAVKEGVELMRSSQISTAAFPDQAAKALAGMAKFSRASSNSNKNLSISDVDKKAVTEIFAKAKKQNQTAFPEAEALQILKPYNLPTLRSEAAYSAEQAEKLAKEINTSLALKIISKDVLHKSDAGGVKLFVEPKDASKEYEVMMERVQKNKPEAKLDGVLLMEMAPKNGMELIVGVNKVPGLGSMLMLGMGGIYVEILKDVQFAFAPLTEDDIERMVKNLKSFEILKGARGQKGFDLGTIKDVLTRINQLVVDFPEIAELDINPLLVLAKGKGAKVLDARIMLEE